MDIRTNDLREQQMKYQDFKLIPKKDNTSKCEESLVKKLVESNSSDFQLDLSDFDTVPISPEQDYWLVIESCLKDIDRNFENLEYISKIRSSTPHIESLKELVKIHADVVGVRNEFEVQAKQDEIVFLFKTGKNEWEFFKIFDELLEVCGNYISNKRQSLESKKIESKSPEKKESEKKEPEKKEPEKKEPEKKEPEKKEPEKKELETKKTEEKETKILSEKEESKRKSTFEIIDENQISEIISSKIIDALKKFDHKFLGIDLKTLEMDKKVHKISKSLKKMQNSLEKKLQDLKKIEESKPTFSVPLKRRRFSTVDSDLFSKSKFNVSSPSSISSDSKSEESFTSNCQDQSVVLEKDNDLEDMVYKLRVRGGVKMTDIWRLNNFAVIFNISELKAILDQSKLEELCKLRPWATRWKAKDKYFTNMKKVAPPTFVRNITKYDNSMAGISASLTENYLFHFDLYCTWRKLKLWLSDISSPIDLCITPSYPHKIRSVIADESETGFAILLEKAIPYLTKQRLERTPNLILYSFIDDYPDDYLIKSQYSIIGRHQPTDLRKILKLGNA